MTTELIPVPMARTTQPAVVRDRDQAEEVTQEVFLRAAEVARVRRVARVTGRRVIAPIALQVNLSCERAADPTVAFAAEESEWSPRVAG